MTANMMPGFIEDALESCRLKRLTPKLADFVVVPNGDATIKSPIAHDPIISEVSKANVVWNLQGCHVSRLDHPLRHNRELTQSFHQRSERSRSDVGGTEQVSGSRRWIPTIVP